VPAPFCRLLCSGNVGLYLVYPNTGVQANKRMQVTNHQAFDGAAGAQASSKGLPALCRVVALLMLLVAAYPSSAELLLALGTQYEDSVADVVVEPCDDADANFTQIVNVAFSASLYALGEPVVLSGSSAHYSPAQARAPPYPFS
jgi:hypothetical protein